MSSDHRLSPSSSLIEHTNNLSQDIGALYLSDDFSDVTFIVSGQKFPGHKVILAARSKYFKALLYGGLNETNQQEIELKGATLPAFEMLLKYIYTGHMTLVDQKEEVVIDILDLAHQYGFSELELPISHFLKEILCTKNACLIFDVARLYQLEFLTRICYEYLDQNAVQILEHENFMQLSASALTDLIARDSFFAPEIYIFNAICRWIKANPGIEPEPILAQIRLNLIEITDLLCVVRLSGLLSPEVILDAITARTETDDSNLNYRGKLLVDENVAHLQHGAQVIQGEMRSYLLNGDSLNYDMERGYTRHTITDFHEQGILIKLKFEYTINHIKMLLWDRDFRSYSYYIEVSINQKDWIKIIDYTNYFCRSWQYLYFEPRVVLYIRIVGTNNTANQVFHVVSFEAYYKSQTEKFHNGFLMPTKNIATSKRSASVVEGVSRSRNSLLNGDVSDYNWDYGYTCHQLNTGSILIQLGQPYYVNSMRLLLWDCDDRSYSYYIEVSGNSKNWDLLVDKRKEFCQSWQTLFFNYDKPIVFIRIVGTRNTANGVFHCVHFECPAELFDNSLSKLSVTRIENSNAISSVSQSHPATNTTENSVSDALTTDTENENLKDDDLVDNAKEPFSES